jgi:hypothetical protein
MIDCDFVELKGRTNIVLFCHSEIKEDVVLGPGSPAGVPSAPLEVVVTVIGLTGGRRAYIQRRGRCGRRGLGGRRIGGCASGASIKLIKNQNQNKMVFPLNQNSAKLLSKSKLQKMDNVGSFL